MNLKLNCCFAHPASDHTALVTLFRPHCTGNIVHNEYGYRLCSHILYFQWVRNNYSYTSVAVLVENKNQKLCSRVLFLQKCESEGHRLIRVVAGFNNAARFSNSTRWRGRLGQHANIQRTVLTLVPSITLFIHSSVGEDSNHNGPCLN